MQTAAPPQFSADGIWFWNGRFWSAAITSDGRWRWDGRSWIPRGGRPRHVAQARQLSVPVLLGIAAVNLAGFLPAVGLVASIAAAVVILAVDGRGLVTLNGLIDWRRMSPKQRLIVAAVEIALFQGLVLAYVAQRLYLAAQAEFRLRSVGRARARSNPVRVAESPQPRAEEPVTPAPMDAETIQQRLSALLSEATSKLPADLLEKVRTLAVTVGDVLPAYRASGLDAHDRFIVERTVDDYLPAALQSYLKLPTAYRSVPLPEAGGKTASEVLSDQLDLLIQGMRQVVDTAYRKDLEALLVHGRFLDAKFGQSSLGLNS
jgi:hypothetical protein